GPRRRRRRELRFRRASRAPTARGDQRARPTNAKPPAGLRWRSQGFAPKGWVSMPNWKCSCWQHGPVATRHLQLVDAAGSPDPTLVRWARRVREQESLAEQRALRLAVEELLTEMRSRRVA